MDLWHITINYVAVWGKIIYFHGTEQIVSQATAVEFFKWSHFLFHFFLRTCATLALNNRGEEKTRSIKIINVYDIVLGNK